MSTCAPMFSGFILDKIITEQCVQSIKQQNLIDPHLQQPSYSMEIKSWSKVVTLHKNGFQNSVSYMTPEEISLNIIEINLLSIQNDVIRNWLATSMQDVSFYLNYRYVLQAILNGDVQQQHRKIISETLNKFDANYVNGKSKDFQGEKVSIKYNIKKQKKAALLQRREDFIRHLEDLSIQLFQLDNMQSRQSYFQEKLQRINELISQPVHNTQSDSSYCSDDSTTRHVGYTFPHRAVIKQVTNLAVQKSFFIQTKNRCPLVLDFSFGRFLYKNDDQLAHEMIAMQMARYVNKIIGKQIIIEYLIQPECLGALYEFVENAMTIHQIKKKHQGLSQYFDYLSDGDKTRRQAFLTRFAESYSGFCLLQYLLNLKDRNNSNIMIRDDGSIFHIDLAFIFESGPGGISFESAPFKMTKQYILLMGGFSSDAFKMFETLMIQHFVKLAECKGEFLYKIQILSKRSKEIRCFNGFNVDDYRKKLPQSHEKTLQFVQDLITKSYDSWKTTRYDEYQFKNNNILK